MNDLWQRARRVMPGGVSSPVRAFGAVPGDPPIVARAKGTTLFDVEGDEYLDLVGSWGPLILGHAHPAVVEAVERAARDGLTFGATCRAEIELAETVLEAFPFADRLRFVSSGTEAVMSAVRLARGVTGRDLVIKFDGCYHGHSDGLLVSGGSGLATLGTPSSAGVPEAVAGLTLVLPLDDEEALVRAFAEHGERIAAVLIEPMPANAGLLVQRPEYLEAVRRVSREHGALLIFDEVISGLRVARGGMTELSGITPDLVTLGKVIGGGMPVGAYAGPAAVMDQVAPLGSVYQAGTLSGNPVAMAAGLATLEQLDDACYAHLEALGAQLERGWQGALEGAGLEASVVRVGSVLWIHFGPGPAPRRWDEVRREGAERYGQMHRALLGQGVWMAPSAYEVAFLSSVHTPAEIDRAIEALAIALRHGDKVAL